MHLVILVIVLMAISSMSQAQEDPRPNIILIVADDLGWSDLGVMGSEFYKTPAIDQLASEGMVFTNKYAPGPNCAPSRASLLTGQYTPRHGIYTVESSERGPAKQRKLVPTPNNTVLAGAAVTIAELLKKAGYATASIGKWHLGEGPATGPEGQGFDINIAGSKQGHPPSYFSPYGILNLDDGPKDEYLTHRLTAEALAFLDAHKSEPFFLYLPHFTPHTPIQAPEDEIAAFRGTKG